MFHVLQILANQRALAQRLDMELASGSTEAQQPRPEASLRPLISGVPPHLVPNMSTFVDSLRAGSNYEGNDYQ